jgi:hypothetical protein
MASIRVKASAEALSMILNAIGFIPEVDEYVLFQSALSSVSTYCYTRSSLLQLVSSTGWAMLVLISVALAV